MLEDGRQLPRVCPTGNGEAWRSKEGVREHEKARAESKPQPEYCPFYPKPVKRKLQDLDSKVKREWTCNSLYFFAKLGRSLAGTRQQRTNTVARVARVALWVHVMRRSIIGPTLRPSRGRASARLAQGKGTTCCQLQA